MSPDGFVLQPAQTLCSGTPPPLPTSLLFWQQFFFFSVNSPSPNYYRASLTFRFFVLCVRVYVCARAHVLPWRVHWTYICDLEMKGGWNHPDSCPATEPFRLPDKAVRPHSGSSGQSKLALPFTINKRRRGVPPQPVSELCGWSVFSQAQCALPLSFLTVFIWSHWRNLVKYLQITENKNSYLVAFDSCWPLWVLLLSLFASNSFRDVSQLVLQEELIFLLYTNWPYFSHGVLRLLYFTCWSVWVPWFINALSIRLCIQQSNVNVKRDEIIHSMKYMHIIHKKHMKHTVP